MPHNQPYTFHTLPGGLRCVHLMSPGRVEVCGVVVNAGSRDESSHQHGLAHFVEHTIFKGTTHRRSWHILNRMERVGGELNAYTTKETTTLYSIFPAGNASRAIDLIADLVCNSEVPEPEINKEREVVADEINSYLDMPGEAVFDDIDEILFAGNPLAHNILGTTESLNTFTPESCRGWINDYYTPQRMVFFYSGPVAPNRIFSSAQKCFTPLTNRTGLKIDRIAPAIAPASTTIKRYDSHQAHTVMALRMPSLHSPMRHAIGLLTNIIGGPGMNSLLNVELRERRALVYTVEAGTTLYTDCGVMSIYFGCDPHDTNRCIDLVRRTMSRIHSGSLTPRAIEAARRQYLGQLTIASENRENRALAMGKTYLQLGTVSTPEQMHRTIEQISVNDIAQAATLFNPDNFVTLTLQ